MRKRLICAIFAVSCFFTVSAQNSILTASAFFREVSDYYATISDYEAYVIIDVNGDEMQGKVSFKLPNLLRIDFTDPATQVICFNGDLLTIYLPNTQAVLNQAVDSGDGASSGANLATPNGLTLMSRYYGIAYETGQTPVPLDEDSDEMVVKLVLSRRTASEGFRTIRLSINPDSKLIRRVEATSTKGIKFIFNFTDYALNQGIPDTRFIYDAPASANNYDNFLYTE